MESTSAGTAAAGALVSAIFGVTCLFFVLYAIFFLVVFALVVASMVLWIWMLVDAARRPDEAFPNPGPNTKLIWILVIALGGAIGALVYYLVVVRVTGPVSAQETPGAPSRP